jgi:hypothetical protein
MEGNPSETCKASYRNKTWNVASCWLYSANSPRTLATWHYYLPQRKELAIQGHRAKHARRFDSSALPLWRYQLMYGTRRSIRNVKLRCMHSENTVSCWLYDMGWKTFHESSLQCCLQTAEPQRQIILGIKRVFLVPLQTFFFAPEVALAIRTETYIGFQVKFLL